MKTLTLCLFVTFAAFAADPPQGTISKPQSSTTSSSDSTSSVGSQTFTDHAGKTYTVTQLAEQLQSLRATIDQSLPVLTAFNETYFEFHRNSDKSLGGKLSGVLSGVLNRNTSQNQNNAANSGQSSFHLEQSPWRIAEGCWPKTNRRSRRSIPIRCATS